MTAVEGGPTDRCGMAGLAVWITCVSDRREHAVSESDFAAGVADGLYRAVCGHVVLPRALVSPCGPRCSACSVTLDRCLATDAAARPVRHRGHGRECIHGGGRRWWPDAGPRRVLGWVWGVFGGH